MTEADILSELLSRAFADPDVLGVVLGGSRGKEGTATQYSDYDIYVVIPPQDDRSTRWRTQKSPELDLTVMDLDEFRQHALPGSATYWNRYTFAHAPVLLDRLEGEIERLVQRKGELTPEEARNLSRGALDAYINAAYRSAKNRRDGRALKVHLDAAESVPPLLTALFASYGRVKPYNKYLRWELDRYPLDGEAWTNAVLLPRLEAVLRSGDVAAQRDLFDEMERLAHSRGAGDVIDTWGEALQILRDTN